MLIPIDPIKRRPTVLTAAELDSLCATRDLTRRNIRGPSQGLLIANGADADPMALFLSLEGGRFALWTSTDIEAHANQASPSGTETATT